jgi:hypothetical protein
MTDQQTSTTEKASIPTLTTVDEAAALLNELAETYDWVCVFWDRGWGDSGQIAEISIIADGDGQNPKARITDDVYNGLRQQKVIQPNSYVGFKKRRLHDFKNVQPEPSHEVLAAEARKAAGESLCRELLETETDMPLAAEFGSYPDIQRLGNQLAVANGFVLMIAMPGEIVVTPNNGFLGNLPANPGQPGGAICVEYPDDPAAILGAEFRAKLDAVIREQFGHLEAAY